MTAFIIVVLLTVTVSATCSLLEAVLYSTRVGTLQAATSRGQHPLLATKMLKLKHHISAPISAILILNTVANTAGATLSGMYADEILGIKWVPLFSVCLTMAILIFSEIIPKTLGAIYWRAIWPWIVLPLNLVKSALLPFVWAVQRFTEKLTHGHAIPAVTEEDILGVIHLGTEAGQISEWEGLVARNVIELEEKKIHQIMTPRTVLYSMDGSMTLDDAFPLAAEKAFSRIPVYEGREDHIVGYVTLHAIALAKSQASGGRTLGDIAKPISFIPESANCARLLVDFLKRRLQLAVATDEYGSVAGLVTLEDLIETVLGHEIVDEQDRVVDMRDLAKQEKPEPAGTADPEPNGRERTQGSQRDRED